MKVYLVQARNYRSGDSSCRVMRQTIIAKDLCDLDSKLSPQVEVDILASEVLACENCKKELNWKESEDIHDDDYRQICADCAYRGY